MDSVIDLWDVDNRKGLNDEEKYNLAIQLHNQGKLNSVLVGLIEFRYYKYNIGDTLFVIPELIRTQSTYFKDEYKLFLVYLVAITNHPSNNELLDEFYNYIDTLDQESLSILSWLVPNNKIILDYLLFRDKDFDTPLEKVVKMMEYTLKHKPIDLGNVLSLYTSFFVRGVSYLLKEGEDITRVAELLFKSEQNIPMYKSKVLISFVYYISYDQLDMYQEKGLIDFMDKDVIGSMLGMSIYGSRDRFLHLLNYYVSKGLTYQNLLESVTTDNIGYLVYDKINVVKYLIDTGKVSIKSVYEKGDDDVKYYLDKIILNQI